MNPFNIMAFPSGPLCNLQCEYCYYLDKTELYPEEKGFQMSEDLLEEYIRQTIKTHPGTVIPFGWQGGEPTLRGLDFFKKAVNLQKKYLPKGYQATNAFQTNGRLITDEWCRFFKDNNFLVGLSLDGPAQLHNHYRKDKKGQPTYKQVMKALDLLQKYDVEYNVLTVVNELNSGYPGEIYNFFLNKGIKFIQFIPLVIVRDGQVKKPSVTPTGYARFLIGIFNEWVKNGYGEVFVQIFEEAVSAWYGRSPQLCVFSKTCGLAPVLEHNGDLYSCDHFVMPSHRLGNIQETSLEELIFSKQQQNFGQAKKNSLPVECLECKFRFICNGGCPKNRIALTPDGKKGLNYLCRGYQQFFNYIDPYMRIIVNGLENEEHPGNIQDSLIELYETNWSNTGRNDLCPCGSGKKHKKCCLNL